MFPFAPSFGRPLLVALALLAAGPAFAQLAANSPFISAGGGTAAPTQNAPLEYRGMMTTLEGQVQYRIYDPARKAGIWLKLNEHNADFGVVAKQYDSEHNTLAVEHQGQTLTLAERVAKTINSGAAPQIAAAPPPPNNPMLPSVTQSVAVNPTPAQEQQRLEAVAAEVARRRALREQAAAQMSQGAQPQVVNQPAPVMQPQVVPPMNTGLRQKQPKQGR